MSIFSNKDLEEFRTIWKDEFNEELTLDQAQMEAEQLLSTVYQFYVIYQRGKRASNHESGG